VSINLRNGANTMPRVVIDPGHGGDTSIGGSSPNNATGPAGTLEKHLTLDVARHAARALGLAGHSVSLTRDGDLNLALDERAGLAKSVNADAFVSKHFNGFGDPHVQGTETWVHSLASNVSRNLAACVQSSLLDVTRYRDRGVQAKKLKVLDPSLHDPTTAACLAEVSFITNGSDERRLQDPAYVQQLGEAIATGITEYLESAQKRIEAASSRAALTARTAQKRGPTLLGLGGRADPIEHVVVLMLENRSFDHMLGGLRRVFSDLDGVDPTNPGFSAREN
jgi:N-acetylmuramoyl-L-alanine amidase